MTLKKRKATFREAQNVRVLEDHNLIPSFYRKIILASPKSYNSPVYVYAIASNKMK